MKHLPASDVQLESVLTLKRFAWNLRIGGKPAAGLADNNNNKPKGIQ